MLISKRCTGIRILQMMLLLLLVFFRMDHVPHLPHDDGDAINAHLSQHPADIDVEFTNSDEDTVEADHADGPEYSLPPNVQVPLLTPGSGVRCQAAHHQYFPVVYLPIFSPPKICA